MKKKILVTGLFVALGYLIGGTFGYACGKKDGREEMTTELKEAAAKSPIYCTSKDGVRLVMKKESFEGSLKQPIGFM